MLSEAVDLYVARRRAEGRQFVGASNVLRDLSRHSGNIDLCDLTAERIKMFLGNAIRPATRSSKLSAIRCFAQYCFLRGMMPELLLERPVWRRYFRVPTIYTRTDMRGLIRAIDKCKWQGEEIDSSTLRTILVLLYATGITVEEVLAIRFCNIDLEGSRLLLDGTFSMPARVLPIGADLKQLLGEYVASKAHSVRGDELLFQYRNGRNINRHNLWQRFRRLHKQAGIVARGGNSPSPRDLRPTFAVHRLTHWIQDGENLNELLPALSTYMGYARLTKAEQFLAYSPERFRTDLSKLSPGKSERRWRDEPELLRFLSSL